MLLLRRCQTFASPLPLSHHLLKCLLVAFMIIVGFGAWHNDVAADYDTFFPEGVGGTVTGASLLFFGFIGFDEVGYTY
jgi:L-asparagine transporter-like permease